MVKDSYCHCCGSSHYCSAGFIPDLGLSGCHGEAKKKLGPECDVIHYISTFALGNQSMVFLVVVVSISLGILS